MPVTSGRARPRAKPLVYQATNLVNGKRYIGVTMESLGSRRAKHFWAALNGKSTMPIARAIRKYGKGMFRFVMLKRLPTYEKALSEEARLVAALKPEYNVGVAGLGNSGWHHTAAQRRAISERNKGKPGYWTGKRLPDHVRQLFVEKAAHPEQRAKWEEWRKLGPLAEQRPVICLNDASEHKSIRLAAEAYGLDEKAIGAICRGRGKTVRGYAFRYADGSTPVPAAPRKGKLSREQVSIIKVALEYGASYSQLAWVYDTHYVTINRIALGNTWGK